MNNTQLRNKLLLRGMSEKEIDFHLVPKSRFRSLYEKKLKKLAIKKFGKDTDIAFIDKGLIFIDINKVTKSVIFIMDRNNNIEEIEFKGI